LYGLQLEIGRKNPPYTRKNILHERQPKPMKGWLMVELDGYKTTKQLVRWVKISTEFAATLPPK